MAIECETPDQLEYRFYPVANGSFSFKVRAANDAHIALTSGPLESDPMVEVFIGGWNNSKSVIRKNRTKPDVAEASTPDVLNAGEFRGFWIRWYDGVYTVGNDGEAAAFLSWQDPSPFQINYAGVCTGWGATGSWLIEGHPEFKTNDSLTYQFHPFESTENGMMDILFRGPSNCHIALLSTKAEVKPYTEIILGGWENKASVIRIDGNRDTDLRRESPNIVNANDFTPFHIEWQNGTLSVRRGDRNGPMVIERKDCVKFNVEFVGIRTAWGATGSWKVNLSDRKVKQLTVGAFTPSAPAPAGNVGGWQAPPVSCGTGGSQCWVPSSGGQVPPGGIVGGQDGGDTLYVARAHHEGALIPGKLVPSHQVTYIAWGGGEHAYSDYEVLCGNGQWVPCSGNGLPPNAVPGGESEEGEPLFIGRVMHEGSFAIGKVQPSHSCVYVSYGGQELSFPEYEVLVA